jgi:hypothetical protein
VRQGIACGRSDFVKEHPTTSHSTAKFARQEKVGMSFHTRQALKYKLREGKAPPKPVAQKARKFVQNHSPKYRGRCSWCSYSMRHIQRPVVCCLVSWENIVNLEKESDGVWRLRSIVASVCGRVKVQKCISTGQCNFCDMGEEKLEGAHRWLIQLHFIVEVTAILLTFRCHA